MSISVFPGQRLTVTGATGSGKSFLSMDTVYANASRYRAVFIADPKNDKDLKRLGQLIERKLKVPVLRYVPKADELDNFSLWNDFFAKCFRTRNSLLFNDELAMSVKTAEIPAYHRAIFQQGRAKGISAICCTQRPSRVPLYCYSEATLLATFRLSLESDVKRINEMDWDYEPSELGKYEFSLFNIPDQTQQKMRLNANT